MKKILPALLTVLAMLLFAACGQPPQESSVPDRVAEITTTEKTTTAAPETTTATSAAVTTTTPSETTGTTTESSITTTKKTGTTSRVSTVSTSKTTKVTTVKTTKKPTVTTKPDYTAKMNAAIKSYKRECAVLLYDLEGTVLYSYQAEKAIPGASLIKLPYVYFCCEQLKAGVHTLEESLTYTASWYHGGSGIIRNQGYGKSYSIAQLIEYALKYSDNVAYDMLVYLFGMSGFNDMVKSWGYSIAISENTRFPSVTADFMRTAMEKMSAAKENGKCYKIAWSALCTSQQSYVRPVIGGSEVAVKYGCIAERYHEACYIGGKHPYILVILSGAKGYSPDAAFVKNIAGYAKSLAEEHFAKPAETTLTTTTTTTTTIAAAATTTTTQTCTVVRNLQR